MISPDYMAKLIEAHWTREAERRQAQVTPLPSRPSDAPGTATPRAA